MILMRCSEDMFTDVMYKLIKYDSRHHVMGRANYSTSVYNMFKDKKNAYVTIEIASKLCGRWILYLNSNMNDLLVRLRDTYKEKRINVQPIREFSGYVAMLQVAQIEWEQVREIIAPWIANDLIHQKHFYDHLNRAFDLMLIQSSSLVSTLYDEKLQSRFKYEIENMAYGERWMEATFTRFSFTNYCKIMNEEKKHTKPSNDTSKTIIITPASNVSQPTNPRPRQELKRRDGIPPKSKYSKKQRSEWRNKMDEWSATVSPKLKNEFARDFASKDYCIAYHAKNMKCAQSEKPSCQYGRNGIKRLHFCLCGSREHTIEECKTIWKN